MNFNQQILFQMLTMMTSTGLLIATINLPFTILTIVLVFIFFLASSYCVKPARSLRRLDMASKYSYENN